MAGKKKPKVQSNTIARNKKAKFDYYLHDRFEAGVALEGWEVKSLRAGKCQLGDTYMVLAGFFFHPEVACLLSGVGL